jgi:predicted dehydrogenase
VPQETTVSNASPNRSLGLDRREFVKTAAVAVALPGALSSMVMPRRAYAGGSDTIKLGLIGCGGRGTGAAVQALRADTGCTLTAMGDLFPDRLNSSLKAITDEMHEKASEKVQVSKDNQFTGFDAYQKVIDSGVDVVLLTSYPHFRPAHVKAAVDAGKHVFAEKPLGVDAPGLRSVLAASELAKQKNLAFMVGFCWRHHDGMRAIFDKVNSGALGDVMSVHTTYHTTQLGKNPRQPKWSDMEFQMRNWWHFTWISGDHILEQAVHSIDRLNWALGEKLPTRVTCLGGRAARNGPEYGNVFDHFAAIYEYDDGRRCHHSCRQIDGCPSDNKDYVTGTKGFASINGWEYSSLRLFDRNQKEFWKYGGPTDRDMYQNEHDELFASIRSGKPINDGARAVNSCMTALMGRFAAYTGQTISWEQAMNSKEDLTPAKYEFGDLPTPPVAIPGKTKFA